MPVERCVFLRWHFWSLKVKVTQSCPNLYDPMDYTWNSLDENTGVGSLSFLQGIFPTQGLNPGLPHCRWILYQLSPAQPFLSGKGGLVVGRLGWEEKRYSYVTRCLQEWSCTEGFTLRVSKRKRRRDMGRRKGFERNLGRWTKLWNIYTKYTKKCIPVFLNAPVAKIMENWKLALQPSML